MQSSAPPEPSLQSRHWWWWWRREVAASLCCLESDWRWLQVHRFDPAPRSLLEKFDSRVTIGWKTHCRVWLVDCYFTACVMLRCSTSSKTRRVKRVFLPELPLKLRFWGPSWILIGGGRDWISPWGSPLACIDRQENFTSSWQQPRRDWWSVFLLDSSLFEPLSRTLLPSL